MAHASGEQEVQVARNPEGAPFIRALSANEWEEKTLDNLPTVRYTYVNSIIQAIMRLCSLKKPHAPCSKLAHPAQNLAGILGYLAEILANLAEILAPKSFV